MFLATEPTAQPLDNALLHQWGLVGVLVTVAVLFIPFLWWVYRNKDHDLVAKYSVEIRSSLVGSFQAIVLFEASRFFKVVEGYLPKALTQVDDEVDGPSAFTKLCESIRTLDESATKKELTPLVETALVGVITKEVERLFAIAHSTLDGEKVAKGIAAAVRVNFDAKVVIELTNVAQELAAAERRGRWHSKAKRSAVTLGTAASIGFIVSILFLFIDAFWAEVCAYVLMSASAVLFITALLAIEFAYRCKDFLQRKATEITPNERLLEELRTNESNQSEQKTAAP